MSSETEIRALEERRYKAMCQADVDSLNELLADSLVYTHSTSAADSKLALPTGTCTLP